MSAAAAGRRLPLQLLLLLGLLGHWSVHCVSVKPEANSEGSLITFSPNSKLLVSCEIEEDGDYNVTWKFDERQLASGGRHILRQDGNKYTMEIDKATYADAGYYECIFSVKGTQESYKTTIRAGTILLIKAPTNVNVVEGETLKIQCQVAGEPMGDVVWMIGNNTVDELDDGRIKLSNFENVKNGQFELEAVNMTDRNMYSCRASSEFSNAEAHTYVRVKDKLAALWPFLGICAEVFVLCAIILVYEKKRNKTELDESDTDQSPDQKNSGDAGKDSDVRQRK